MTSDSGDRSRIQTLWARTFVQGLHDAGLREAVVAPGSRSTPLVLALAAHGGFRLHLQIDERSAGFLALGLGKGSGRAAAVVTTSGTATANLFPAVVEASQGEWPLVVLTADRPHRLRGADANQAIDQLGLYGAYPRAFVEVAPASPDPQELRHLARQAVRAVAAAEGSLGGPPGPVHLNFPLSKPLEPHEDPGALEGGPWGGAGVVRAGLEIPAEDPAPVPPSLAEALRERLEGARRPLLLAGPQSFGGGNSVMGRPDSAVSHPVLAAAKILGLPLLADPLSGCRHGAGACRGKGVVVAHYDGMLRNPETRDRLRPDFVLRMGNAPTSSVLQAALAEWSEVEQWVVSPGGRFRDHGNTARRYLTADPGALLEQAAWDRTEPNRPLAGAEAYREAWAAAEAAAAGAPLGLEFPEGWAAREAVLASGAAGGALVVSSSMPIRDVDGYGGALNDPLTVHGNRGASGIDGVVSTVLGVARGSGLPTVGLLGDLAFLHDQNGLLAARDVEEPVALVVVHNDGGGIFHRLPIAEYEPHFTPLFATPHGLNLGPVASLHGLPYREVRTRSALAAALKESLGRKGVELIVVPADRGANHEARQEMEALVAGAAWEALEALDPREEPRA